MSVYILHKERISFKFTGKKPAKHSSKFCWWDREGEAWLSLVKPSAEMFASLPWKLIRGFTPEEIRYSVPKKGENVQTVQARWKPSADVFPAAIQHM